MEWIVRAKAGELLWFAEMTRGFLLFCGFVSVLVACGTAPQPAQPPTEKAKLEKPSLNAAVDDVCLERSGKPPPQPLLRNYAGLAKAARCQREVYTIMGGVTHFLGVKCAHCHREPDYALMTHQKRVANWMVRELIPALNKKGGGEVWCNDCHQGKAKILGCASRARCRR